MSYLHEAAPSSSFTFGKQISDAERKPQNIQWVLYNIYVVPCIVLPRKSITLTLCKWPIGGNLYSMHLLPYVYLYFIHSQRLRYCSFDIQQFYCEHK